MIAAALQEGLELDLADNRCGFKGVYRNGGRFRAKVHDDGKLRSLGTFATPEEAALVYARYVGKKRAAV